jgi:hypothetical protein
MDGGRLQIKLEASRACGTRRSRRMKYPIHDIHHAMWAVLETTRCAVSRWDRYPSVRRQRIMLGVMPSSGQIVAIRGGIATFNVWWVDPLSNLHIQSRAKRRSATLWAAAACAYASEQ